MPKVNKTEVDSAKVTDKDYFIWDTEIKGFGLKVSPVGTKSFVYQFRTPEGRSRRITIGKYSTTLTAEQARGKARKMQRTVEDGGDPLEEKQALRESITMNQLFDLYLASKRFEEKAATTRSIDRGRINRHLRLALGKHFVAKLTSEAVRRAFAAIRDGETADDVKTGNRGRAIVKGGEGTARMAIRLLRAIMRWAIEEGHASNNPASAVHIGSDGQRDTIIESTDDYARLFRVLDAMENGLRLSRPAADAIRVIALTGARRGEITNLIWQWVDLKSGRIVIPAKHHKTGAKTGKPRVIALPVAAQAIIARQPEGAPDGLVFTGKNGPLALSKHWMKVRTEAGLPPGLGLHGLRHSLATMMAIEGAQATDIMAVLGHRQITTAQRYVHYVEDARKMVAEKAASSISAALRGEKPADVVPLKRATK